MNINELSKKSHDNAVEKGFYDCPECGCSTDDLKILHMCHDGEHCETSCEDCEVSVEDFCCNECKDTGIDQNKNIPELLMLVITEISEAVEALRCGKIFDDRIRSSDEYFEFIGNIDDEEDFQIEFKESIKDTFEDEIADVFIRLFDLCGYLGIEIDYDFESEGLFLYKNENITIFDLLLFCTRCIADMQDETRDKRKHIVSTIGYLFNISKKHNINIEKHITAKMQYNKTRPKKHGKEF